MVIGRPCYHFGVQTRRGWKEGEGNSSETIWGQIRDYVPRCHLFRHPKGQGRVCSDGESGETEFEDWKVMSKPNWKRRGFNSRLEAIKHKTLEQRCLVRERKLLALPPEIREEISRQPQLLNFIP